MTATDEAGAARSQRPQRRRKPSAGWVFGPALGVFFAVLALLAFQVRTGNDPALGEPAAAQAQQPRQIVVRRVITRVVIHHPATSGPAASSPAAVQTQAPPATTTAPAPARTAPAPAPLTTQSS